MFGLGTKELIIIAIIFILLFGAKKIPELTNSLVESIRHMRRAFKDVNEDESDKIAKRK